MDISVEMINESTPSDQHTLVFVEPREQALDLPPSSIPPEWVCILRDGFDAMTLVWRDQFNVLGTKPKIERITVVGAIPGKSSGLSQGEGAVEGSLDKRDSM